MKDPSAPEKSRAETTTRPGPRADERRPFVAPRLERRDELPRVTTGMVGTFSP